MEGKGPRGEARPTPPTVSRALANFSLLTSPVPPTLCLPTLSSPPPSQHDDDSGFGFHFTINVDRAQPDAKSGRRMSTSFRHILVQKQHLVEVSPLSLSRPPPPHAISSNTISLFSFFSQLVGKWKQSGYREKTGGEATGPAGRRNAQFFDGCVVDAEMRAWIDTGVPPSRGSMLRFIIWRLELSDDHEGGLKLYDSVQVEIKIRKSR